MRYQLLAKLTGIFACIAVSWFEVDTMVKSNCRGDPLAFTIAFALLIAIVATGLRIAYSIKAIQPDSATPASQWSKRQDAVRESAKRDLIGYLFFFPTVLLSCVLVSLLFWSLFLSLVGSSPTNSLLAAVYTILMLISMIIGVLVGGFIGGFLWTAVAAILWPREHVETWLGSGTIPNVPTITNKIMTAIYAAKEK